MTVKIASVSREDNLEPLKSLLRHYAEFLRDSLGAQRARMCAAKQDEKFADSSGGALDTATVLRDSSEGEHICFPEYEAELKALPDPYCVLLLATVDEEPAGCVLLKPLSEPGACEMKRLWVEPQFRKLSLGRRLVQGLIDEARQREFRYMYLDTITADMKEAHRLYRSLGFEPVARYNDNPIPGVEFFRLALEPSLDTEVCPPGVSSRNL